MRAITGLVWAITASAARPALRLMLRRRADRGKELAARLGERRGIEAMKRPAGRVLWLHAASVGEAISALPLVSALPPDVFTVFTTGTVTSARLLETRLPELGLQDRVVQRFVPLDVPAWAKRFLKHWRPDAACFLESELWPNILAACTQRRVPVALVNARFSARSAAAWRRAPGLARQVLGAFSWIAAQSDADADRLRSLGAKRVEVPGNLKFSAPNLPADPAEVARLSALLGSRPRWLAASTHPADDAIVARVHRALAERHAGLLTAVAPRHPERGAAVAAVMGGAPRRSLGQDFPEHGGAWVADTLGELGLLFRVFPIVFMGKSFSGGGGQNFLEPARLGCAVATGPATQNFTQARDMAVAAGALTVVENEEALITWLDARLRRAAPAATLAPVGTLPSLLAAKLVALMGPLSSTTPPPRASKPPAPPARDRSAAPKPTKARKVIAPKAGARAQPPAFWRHDSGSLLPLVLSPLSGAVSGLTARRVARTGWRAPVPVICCGNAGVGGAGKTTLVLDLAARLQARGLAVHVLTRGYGGSAAGVIRVDPAVHDAEAVGDEALLLADMAPTWRSADRAAAAHQAIAAGAQILVMDDGLQNATLIKSFSLLVIDGGFGFGNGRVLPAGPLREPVRAAAARSNAAVLIGADQAGALASLPAFLPVFAARLVPGAGSAALAGTRVVAFAGIGRPEKFFAMLRDAGVVVVRGVAFADHYPFTARDLSELRQLADDLDAIAVTTPKDFVRIPSAMKPHFQPVGVSMIWEDAQALEALLDRACAVPPFT